MSGHSVVMEPYPLYPQKRTSRGSRRPALIGAVKVSAEHGLISRGKHEYCPLRSRGRHHGCWKPLFRMAKQGLSQISGGRILRIIGYFVLSLSRRCFGASVGNRFCRNTSDQRWPIHRPFHPLLALFLFWLRQEAKGLKRTSPCIIGCVAQCAAHFRVRSRPHAVT